MNPRDILPRQEILLREKQAQCKHPSFKCSICGKYKDNLFNEYQAEIDILLILLEHYESILDIHKISHPSYYELLCSDIIEEYRKEMVRKYMVKMKRYTDDLELHSE